MVAVLASAATARAEGEAKDHKPIELDLFPLVGGSSDIGIGGGLAGAVAHFAPGEKQYRWKVELSGIVTYSPSNGRSHIPYTDVYALMTIPNLGRGVRLELRPSFTLENTLGYYGLGNASQRNDALHNDYYQYGRTHPTMQVMVRLPLFDRLFVKLANYFTYNSLDIVDNSRLAQDFASPDPEIRKILGTAKSHAVDVFEYGLVYDTRDEETATRRGQYHEVGLRYSPGGTSFFPYSYQQLDATARFYATLPGDAVTFATRVVGDVQFGDPPFYELARFQETYALGGSKGVRGVPAQRYYGKVKVFGNFEIRAHLFDFHLFGKDMKFGVAGFFDAGRLWTDFHSHPELDGTGLGLKYGTGGGLRLQQGKTFIARLDLAWSPDAKPVGGYFAVGEIF